MSPCMIKQIKIMVISELIWPHMTLNDLYHIIWLFMTLYNPIKPYKTPYDLKWPIWLIWPLMTLYDPIRPFMTEIEIYLFFHNDQLYVHYSFVSKTPTLLSLMRINDVLYGCSKRHSRVARLLCTIQVKKLWVSIDFIVLSDQMKQRCV